MEEGSRHTASFALYPAAAQHMPLFTWISFTLYHNTILIELKILIHFLPQNGLDQSTSSCRWDPCGAMLSACGWRDGAAATLVLHSHPGLIKVLSLMPGTLLQSCGDACGHPGVHEGTRLGPGSTAPIRQ